jgi:peptidyl-prolyl cis-trans isomerase D
MAILNSIRKRGFFLIIIIALALFAFVLDGVINSKTGGSVKGQETAATINGIDISRIEFMEQVEATKQNLGGQGSSSQAMNIVWDRELRRVLFEEQFEKLGLSAESAQVKEALRSNLATNPTFTDETGAFSETKLQEYLATIKLSPNPTAYNQWLAYEKSTIDQIMQDMYLNMIKGGMRSTIADGEQQYRYENDKINIEYVEVPYASISDEEIPVSEKEIRAYVKAHANEFEVLPEVDIQYVSISEDPSVADIAASKTDILSDLNDSVEQNNVTNSTDTIYGFRNTKDNEAYILANSDDVFNDAWLYKNLIPEAIADTLYNLNVGNIYGPYELNNGFNLSKIIATRKMPDTVTARHILIPIGLNPTDSITRTDDQAKKTADSLVRVIKSNRSKFPALVSQFSSDNGSVEKGGRYENFAYNAMVAPFRDFAFEGKKGDVGVAKTNFGYHVIEIEGQKNLQKVIKVATLNKANEPSEETLNEVFSQASRFEVEARKGDFNEIATEKGLEVKPVNKIGAMDETIPGVGPNRGIVSWGFDEETSVGDIKRFSITNGYVIAQVTRRNGKTLKSVAEASAAVTPILRNMKKAQKIRASFSGTTLEEMAASQNVTVKNATALTMSAPTIAGSGAEPKVVGSAFGKSAGETTNAIDGESGVFIVRVLSVNAAPVLDNYTSYVNQLNTKAAPTVNTGVFNALKNAAEIEDNRSDFY